MKPKNFLGQVGLGRHQADMEVLEPGATSLPRDSGDPLSGQRGAPFPRLGNQAVEVGISFQSSSISEHCFPENRLAKACGWFAERQ